MTKPNGTNSIEIGIAYLHGRLEAQIESFADVIGLPAPELTYRLGELLSTKARGTLLGTQYRLPNLRRAPAEPYSAPRPLALAGSAHSQTPRSGEPAIDSPAGLNKSGNLRGMNQDKKAAKPSAKAAGQGGFWSDLTQEERDAEMLIRMENRKKLRPQDKRLIQTLRDKVSAKVLADRRVARSTSKVKTNGKIAKAKAPQKKSYNEKKQQIYRERHAAKLEGRTLPPLPA